MTQERQVLTETVDHVTVLTLNRPNVLNAVTPQMAEEFVAALRAADADTEVRVIVVTGAGRGFCSGADLSLLETVGSQPQVDYISMPHVALRISTPVVAAINGPVAGIGFVYLLSSDIRFADSAATISTTFSRLGLVAEYGSAWMLQRVVGLPIAMDLLLTGRTITGEEAARIGLVHEATPPGRSLERAMAYARSLAEECSPSSLREIKEQVYGDAGRDLRAATEDSLRRMTKSFDRPDVREALDARREQRRPRFPPAPIPKMHN